MDPLAVADPKQHYDVALSFMMADMGLARDLYHRLSGNLSVFFFERKQEELTGRDGLEGFRAPFRDALVSVVLYRPPYGEANWTGVEKTAIGEACQKRGYRNLFVVMTDPTAKLPDWIPATHIYFSVSMFPAEELVGAIKTKVLELGGKLEPMTAQKRAEQHVAEQQYQADRKAFRTTGAGTVAMQRDITATFDEINRKCADFAAKGIMMRSGSNTGRCVITNETVSVVAYWNRSGYPGIERDELVIEEYEWYLPLPSEPRRIYFEGDPRPCRTSNYELELTRSRETVWQASNGDGFLSSAALADRVVINFFELAERVTAERNRPTY